MKPPPPPPPPSAAPTGSSAHEAAIDTYRVSSSRVQVSTDGFVRHCGLPNLDGDIGVTGSPSCPLPASPVSLEDTQNIHM